MKPRSFLLLLSVTAGLLPSLSSCTSTRALPAAGTFQRTGDLRLEVATSKTCYRVGETLSFTLCPSEDCYLSAWVIGADGLTTPLYPNAHDSGHIFRKGVIATLPGDGSFQFRVTPPTGREQLVVVASTVPVPTFPCPPAPGLWLKGLDVAPHSTGPAPLRGEARIIYEVEP